MSKNTIMMAAIVALTCLSVWQWAQGRALQQSNAALQAQIRVYTAAPKPVESRSPLERRTAGPATESPAAGSVAANGTTPGTPPRDPQEAQREARFREFRQMDRAQRADSRILTLKTKLNISPEQEGLVRAALTKGSGERDALRQTIAARSRGTEAEEQERRRGDAKQFAAIDAAQEKAITDSFTAEQLAAYGEHQAEERKNEVENQANRQLGDLQNRLSLTEDQKEAVFQQFARQAQTFNWRDMMAQGTDMQAAMEEQMKGQLEAMKQILTPEQFELYNKQEEQRAGMFRNGGFPPPPGGF